MEILINIDGGRQDELQSLTETLRDVRDLGPARIARKVPEIEPGRLGAEAVLQIIGDAVILPILVQALYDHLTRRRRTRSGADLNITITRTDLPDGTREVTLSYDGSASEVIEAARKELE